MPREITQQGGMNIIQTFINDRRSRWYEEAEEIRQTTRRSNAVTRLIIENIGINNPLLAEQYFRQYRSGVFNNDLENELTRELGHIQEWDYLTEDYVEYFLYSISPELELDGGDIRFVKGYYRIISQIANLQRPHDFIRISDPGEDPQEC